ncbi:MAG: HEAT repeat domain-containing protein [Cyanobacteriota bacterium]
MIKKLLLSIFTALLVFNISFSHAANETNNSVNLKEKAFKTLSDALFDEKIHYNIKIDIFDIINNFITEDLPPESPEDLVQDFYQNMIDNPDQSTFTIDLLNNDQQESSEDIKKPAETDKNIIELLKKTVESDNDNIILYGLDSISKGKVKELLPDVIIKLKNFDSDDLEVETSLISTIGKIGNDSAIETLQPYLDDENLRIKLNALQAIGDIKTENANKILKEYVSKDSLELALLSSGILVNEGDEKALKLLQEGIESPIILTQQKTMIAISNVTNPVILPLIKIALKSDNDVIKAYALNNLGKIDTIESVKLIQPYIEDEKLMPRAIIALSQNSSKEAFRILESMMKSDNNIQKTYIIAVLSRIKDKRILPLLKIALDDKNENISIAAAKILHTFEDDSGIDALKIAIKSNNEDISLRAAAFLGYIGDNTGQSILLNAIDDTNLPSWKRLDISIILEKLGDKGIVPKLKELLSKQRPKTLPKDLNPSAKTLKEFIKDDSVWVQLNSAVFLIRNKDSDCLPILEKLSNDPDLLVRTTAVDLLGELGSEKALPVLNKSLEDESVRVRVKAAESIIKILSAQKTHKNIKEKSNTPT